MGGGGGWEPEWEGRRGRMGTRVRGGAGGEGPGPKGGPTVAGEWSSLSLCLPVVIFHEGGG